MISCEDCGYTIAVMYFNDPCPRCSGKMLTGQQLYPSVMENNEKIEEKFLFVQKDLLNNKTSQSDGFRVYVRNKEGPIKHIHIEKNEWEKTLVLE
jgi:hypothetical protein